VTIIVRNHLISPPASRCLCSRTPLARFPRIQLWHNTEQTLFASSLCFCRTVLCGRLQRCWLWRFSRPWHI